MKQETAALLGQQVGHIRVVDVLGEGGMGAVYVGFDAKLQRKVALKAIRSEFRMHEEAKVRFLREARILSQLDHPHICTVHDFIEGDDCDFLVLELVKGKSLRKAMKDELDKARKMAIARQLLEVLVAVRGQGVIHRDLKPENVMIREGDDVKVLDFGLARSVEEELVPPSTAPTIAGDALSADLDSGATLTPSESSRSVYLKTKLGTLIGTAGYMSPEQARGEPATAASDMYSLGLMLQEMLTRQPPFEPGLDARELVRRAAAGDTFPVTGLSPGETALIERLKSLAPGARPSSVDALAQLRRVVDRPKRRRRRVVVAGVWLILVLLSAALAFQSIRATRGEWRAEREAETAKEVSDFLVGLFQVSDPSEALGNTVTAREILDKGAERIEGELGDQPLVQARLMGTMGMVFQALGLYEQAAPLLEGALRLGREHLPEAHLDLAESLNNLADLLRDKGDYDAAEPLAREALAMNRRLLGDEHPCVATSLNNLARLLKAKGDYGAAEPLYREALAMRRRLLGDEHPDVATSLNNLAGILWAKSNHDTAEPLYREALAMKRRLLGDEHPDVATSLNNLASLLWDKGDYGAAEPLLREALAMRRRLLGDEHPDVAMILNNLAVLLRARGDFDAAGPLYREALAMRRRLLGDEHPDVAMSLNNLASLLQAKGDFDAAEPLFREALAMYRRLLGDENPSVGRGLNNLAALLKAKGDYDGAEPLYREALAMHRRLLGGEHPDMARSLLNLGRLLQAKGEYGAAEPLFRDALAVFKKTLPLDHPHLQRTVEIYASLLREMGRDAEAEELEARLAAHQTEGDSK